MTKICAIHQPNFFPWLGYFDKIKKSNIFVFLDDVQNSKTGSSWFNRTMLDCFGKSKWYTCPIARPSGLLNINQVQFGDVFWKKDFMNVLQNYYKDHINIKNGFNFIKELIFQKDYDCLASLNKNVIQHVALNLGINSEFISSSKLSITSLSTQRLIDICKNVGADTYLCGRGATGYQEDDLFKKNNIKLLYQNYIPEPYKEDGFIPGLSVIDYIMNVL